MASVSMTIRIADMDRCRLLIWELRQLESDMRVGADPFAERLERALDRFFDGPEDDPTVDHIPVTEDQ